MNKFLKLLLIALVAAVLPGCGSEKTNGSGKTTPETAEQKAAREAEEKKAAADEVNPDFVNFFKLFADNKKPLTVTFDGGVILPAKSGANAVSAFANGSSITFAVGADLTKVGSFKLTDGVNTFQAVGGVARVDGSTTSIGNSELGGFVLSVVKSGEAPTITLTTPGNHGKGTDAAAVDAASPSNNLNQYSRKFELILNQKLVGAEASFTGKARLNYTVDGKTVGIDVSISIS